MANDAVEAAQIRPQSSSLNVFWAASTLQTANALAVIRHTAARLNPNRGLSRRSPGRHAAPARRRTAHSRRASR
jgi:hypothetical protein